MDAGYFDEWYANMSRSPVQAAIQQAALGLPPEVEPTSLLPWQGIADVVDALALSAGDLLVDLACGRGGYGLEVVRRTGAQLIGIDFSRVAIERAREVSSSRGVAGQVRFEIGDLTATGLADAVADAVLCVDAMQFADPYARGLAETRRILRAGGRLVLTGWQLAPGSGSDLPERLRHDIAAQVSAAGFVDVVSCEMTAWHDAERAMWLAALATSPDDGDPAMDSMRSEAARTMAMHDRMRRLMVTARRA